MSLIARDYPLDNPLWKFSLRNYRGNLVKWLLQQQDQRGQSVNMWLLVMYLNRQDLSLSMEAASSLNQLCTEWMWTNLSRIRQHRRSAPKSETSVFWQRYELSLEQNEQAILWSYCNTHAEIKPWTAGSLNALLGDSEAWNAYHQLQALWEVEALD